MLSSFLLPPQLFSFRFSRRKQVSNSEKGSRSNYNGFVDTTIRFSSSIESEQAGKRERVIVFYTKPTPHSPPNLDIDVENWSRKGKAKVFNLRIVPSKCFWDDEDEESFLLA